MLSVFAQALGLIGLILIDRSTGIPDSPIHSGESLAEDVDVGTEGTCRDHLLKI